MRLELATVLIAFVLVLIALPTANAAGLALTPSTLAVDEVGAPKTYQLQLSEACAIDPCSATLLLSFSGSGVERFAFTPDIIRWKEANWNTVVEVTVTPIDNSIDDALSSFEVQHNVVNQQAQVIFQATLIVDITNDDVAKLKVTSPSNLVALEGGSGATIPVVLNTQPVADVTTTLSMTGSELSITSPTKTFDSSTWQTSQNYALQVINDAVAAATRVTERLVRITSASSDGKYNRVSAVQRVALTGASAVGGTVTLSYNGYITDAIGVGSGGASIATTLSALPNVYAVTVSASASGNGYNWLVTFDQNSGQLPLLVVGTSGLTGSGAAAAVSRITVGVPPYDPQFSGEFLVNVIDDDLKVTITSITAQDTGNQAGPGNADSMIVLFSEGTNRPTVNTKAAIDALFTFSTTIGTTYAGEWILVDVPGSSTMTVTAGSASVGASGDASSHLSPGDTLVLGGTSYTVQTAAITGGTAQSPTSTVTLTTTFAGASGTVTAKHRSRSQLLITISDTTAITSYPDMRVGTLSVTLKTSAAGSSLSDRYGASTAASFTRTVALGTWGAMNPPQVSTATAVSSGGQSGMGNGDRLVVAFDSDTNRAGFSTSATLTKAQVDALFTFSADGSTVSLGTSYTGQWESDTTIRITLVSTLNAASPRLTRVGKLVVTAKSGNTVLSLDQTSSASTGSATLAGDWGAHTAPTITSMTAADAVAPYSPSAGISVGDTIIVLFNKVTSMPPAANRAQILTWLTPSATLGGAYTGEWLDDGLRLRITLTDLTGTASAGLTKVGTFSAQVTALLKSADESSPVSSSSSVLGGTWGARAAPTISSAVAADPDAPVAGLSASDTLTVTFNTATNQPTVTNPGDLFIFTNPGGTSSVWDVSSGTQATGQWASNTQYVITVVSNAGVNFANTRVGHMIAGVKASANLKTLDGSSVASTATATISGTWGAHDAVVLSTAVASADGGQAGLGNGDKLTLTFDKDTNRATGTVESPASLLTLSASIGGTLSGLWTGRRVFEVTVDDVSGAGAVASTRVGILTATVKSSASLLTSDASSPASTSQATTTGTWGAFAAPAIVTAVASDPVSSLASAGYTNGDILTLTFDITTNRAVATSMSKAQVDSLLAFSNGASTVNMGTDYTAVWTSTRVLRITLVDTAGSTASLTTIGALRVAVKAAGGLKSEDLSSPDSTSSALISGTWGDFPAPAITTATAADGGTNAGLGVGDTLTLKFDQGTNKAGQGNTLTKAQVDSLLAFSASIGTGYTGSWTATDTLVLTVTAVDTSVPSYETAVGRLYVEVKAAAGLRSADGSSGASTSVGLVDLGTWGARAAPTLVAVDASDTGNNQGLGNGDSVRFTFSAGTSQKSDGEIQTVKTSASAGSTLGGTFVLAFKGESTANIARDISAANMQATLRALPSIGPGGVVVTRTSTADATGGFTWSITFTSTCRYGVGDVEPLVADTANLVGTGKSIVVTEVRKGTQVSGSILSGLISLSASVGTTVQASWASATILELQVVDTTGADIFNSRIGALTASVLAAGALKSADGSSPVVTASNELVGGTWGVHTAPLVSTAVASDAAPLQQGIGAGDKLTITFNKGTNQEPQTGTGRAGVLSLFSFSSDIGTAYSGAWTSATTFVITISDATGADLALTRVGLLEVTVVGDIVTTDLSSSKSSSKRVVSGTWGDHSKPLISSVVAFDDAPIVKGISDADYIVVTFDKATSEPAGTPIDLFTISSSLGTVSGAWTSSTTYRITLTNPASASVVNTRVGLLTVTAKTAASILSRDQSSPPADNQVTLTGSYGNHDAPVLVSAVAADDGQQPGVGVGDTLTLTFNIDVNRNAGLREPSVPALVSPSASIGSGLTGDWVDTKTFKITITNDAGKGSVTATQVGVMTVAILSSANLKSADFSSIASAASITISGDWGVFPAPVISSAVASDPVSTPATAGLTAGDRLTVTFNMATNRVNITTKAQVDALFTFSSPVGQAYTGTWISATTLRIDFADTGGVDVVATRVNHLTVTVKAAAGLRSSDGSSVDSTSSGTVTGSWGPFSKPTIVSITAADATPVQPGIGDGDTLTIKFSLATNTPALADANAVANVFTFNSPIATVMSGTWTAADTLVLTIATVHSLAATTNSGATAVGALYLRVNAAGALRSADFSSPAADGLGFVNLGTWGDKAAPAVQSALASNTAPNEGIGVGDTLTITFDAVTSRLANSAVQTVSTGGTSTLGGTFRLTYKGETTAAIAHNAAASAVVTALVALPSIGAGGVTATAAPRVLSPDVGAVTWTITFTSSCRLCHGTVPAMTVTNGLTGAAATVTVAVVATGSTLTKATVDTLVTFSSSLGAGYTGTWTSHTSLAIRLNDLTGAGAVIDTVPGTLAIGVQAAAGLVSADKSSPAASGAFTVGGSWGKHSMPRIVSATASNDGALAGINEHDRVTIVFNKETNKPTAFTSLLRLSPATLGRTLSYFWIGPQLIIDLGPTTGTPLHVSTTRIGVAALSLLTAGNLRSADLTSDAANGTVQLTGTWGPHTAPTIVSAVAADGSPFTRGLSVGDTLTVTFDQITNRPDISTPAGLASILSLSASLGTVSATWVDDTQLRLLVTAVASGDETPAVTAVSKLVLSVPGSNPLRSADLSSPEGKGSATLTGSWGKQLPPAVISAEAFDTGNSPGLNTGDTLVLTFDKSTNKAPHATAGLLNLLKWGAKVGPVSGTWISRRQLRVTFLDTSARDPPAAVVAGALNVTVCAQGGLRSADESSDNSTGVALVSGSFGAYPAPALVSAVASDTGNQEGIGVGDSYLLRFSLATNQPSAAQLAQLVTYSANVGVISFAWLSATELRVTLMDLTTAAQPHLTRVGLIRVFVKAAGGSTLRSADGSSPAADTVADVTGTYGPHSPPTITVFDAADTGNAPGENNGDTITVTFNKPTSAPGLGKSSLGKAAQRSAVDAVFAFREYLGKWYRGTWNTVKLTAGTATTTAGSTLIYTSSSVQGSLVLAGASIRVGDFDSTIASFVNASAFHLASPYPGPSSTGVALYAQSRTTALITVTDTTGFSPFKTRVGGLRMAVRQQAGLRSSDLTSEPTVAERTLGGTWGPHSPPQVITIVAADESMEPGVGVGATDVSTGDQLLVTFDQSTNTPPVATKAQVDAALNFSAPIGSNYVGTWLTKPLPGYAVLEVGSTALKVSEDLRPHLKRGTRFRVGFTELQVALSGTYSATSVPLAFAVPAATIALNPSRRLVQQRMEQLRVGGEVLPRRRLSSLEDELAARRQLYTASDDKLMLIVTDTTGAGVPSLVAPGALVVGVKGVVKSADESSPPVDSVKLLEGSWNPAPIIVLATINHGSVDTISNGLDKDDFLLVVFNIETNMPALNNKTAVDRVFSLSASLGTDYSGTWINPSAARVRVHNATGAGTAAAVRAGVLLVQVRPEANLVARYGNSGASQSFRSVIGLWGSEIPPELVLVTAVNGDGREGVGAGDKIHMQFDRDTNTPQVEATPEVQSITLSSVPVQEVQSVALTGAGISGFFSLAISLPGASTAVSTDLIATTAVAMMTQEAGGAYGTGIGESMQAKLQAVEGVGDVTVQLSVDPVSGANRWAITFQSVEGSMPVMQLNVTNLSFAFGASGLGAGVVISRSQTGQTLGGTLTFSMGGADVSTAVSTTASAAQVAAALASLPNVDAPTVVVDPVGVGGSVSWTVTFVRNVGDLPQLSVAVNSLTGSNTAVVIRTQIAGVTSVGRLNSIFETSSPLPSAIGAAWLTPRILEITLHETAMTNSTAANLASLRVAVKTQDAVVRSAGGTVAAIGGGSLLVSAGGVGIGGSYGLRAAPAIAGITAVDTTGTVEVATGDVLQVKFNVDTNTPRVTTMHEVDELLWMSSTLGCNYTGVWATRRDLHITVRDASCAHTEELALGVLAVQVRGSAHLRTEDLTSSDSTSRRLLQLGSWGGSAVPVVTSVTALDSALAPVIGVSNGDTIVVEFDRKTSMPTVATKADLDSVFTFTPALAADYTGDWLWTLAFEGAIPSADKAHLLLASSEHAKILGPSMEILIGSSLANSVAVLIAATPSVWTTGPDGEVSSVQLGNVATMQRMIRSNTLTVVPLAAAISLPAAVCVTQNPCTLRVWARSSKRLRITVVDSTGAPAAGTAIDMTFNTASHPNGTDVKSADRSSPAVTGTHTIGGDFGSEEAAMWYELWWFWLIVFLFFLMLCCCILCWLWVKENYIFCDRNKKMGGNAFHAEQPTQLYTSMPAPARSPSPEFSDDDDDLISATSASGRDYEEGEENLARARRRLPGQSNTEYRGMSGRPTSGHQKALSGYSRTNRSKVRKGQRRMPTVAPNVVVHTSSTPAQPPELPQRERRPRSRGRRRQRRDEV